MLSIVSTFNVSIQMKLKLEQTLQHLYKRYFATLQKVMVSSIKSKIQDFLHSFQFLTLHFVTIMKTEAVQVPNSFRYYPLPKLTKANMKADHSNIQEKVDT